MNPQLDLLHSYPFEKLAALLQDSSPPPDLAPISLSIGEPKHAAPEFVKQALIDSLEGLSVYPPTAGSIELRQTISDWLNKRFSIPENLLDAARHVLPVNGTREALFSFTQTVVSPSRDALVLLPNPFYQIYEGAAILAGAKPHYLNCNAENGFIPDLDSVPDDIWKSCQVLHLCSPGNPSGAVMSLAEFGRAIELAEKYDFVIASDECYSELYFDEADPPVGLLQACIAYGNPAFKRCVVFHSLSKRSNLPGLRSGFVAGDAEIIAQYHRYRTYHGCAMSPPVQQASIAAWRDEHHVIENRNLYREKFTVVIDVLGDALPCQQPGGGFYLWPHTPISDTEFTRLVYEQANVKLLPGQFLSRDTEMGNPGENRVRMALVAELEQCVEAAQRIKEVVGRL